MSDAQENYRGVWGNRIGFGARPALIVIDFVRAYTTEGAPLFAPGVRVAVAETVELLQVARENGVPVIHTTVVYNPRSFLDGGAWVKKAPVLKCLADPELGKFCEGMEPRPDEVVVTKQYASAFFGTSLASMLTAYGIDTIVLTGCTTSGCIRATSIDGVQHGFRTIVVEECVGDRHDGPHQANLFDINSKYGDVVLKAEVIAEFRK